MMDRPNHVLRLVFAILATLFCCLPIGIAAIVFAAIGMSRESSGDYAGADSAAKTAMILIWVSVGVSLAIWLIYILVFVLILGASLLPFLAL